MNHHLNRFKKLPLTSQLSLLIASLLLLTIGITINKALTRQEKRTRASSNNLPAYSTPTPTCSPRPACLNATPQCSIPEPTQGWCESKSALGESSYLSEIYVTPTVYCIGSCLTPTPTDAAKKTPPCNSLGDLNNDGYVTYEDKDILKKIVSGEITPTETQKKRGDLTGDGKINAADPFIMEFFLQGTTKTFPACPKPATTPTLIPCASITPAQSSIQVSNGETAKTQGIFEDILKLLIKLIEDLLKLIGIIIPTQPLPQPTIPATPAPSVQPSQSFTPQPGTPTPMPSPCVPLPTPSPVASNTPNPNQKYKMNVGITTFSELSGYNSNNFISEYRDFINTNSKFDITLVGNNKYPPLSDDEIPVKPYSNCADGRYWPKSSIFHPDTIAKFPSKVSINIMAFDSKNKPLCFGGTYEYQTSIHGLGLISVPLGAWPDVDNKPSCVNNVCTWKRALTQVFVHEWLHSIDSMLNSVGYPDFPSSDECGKYGYNGNDDPGWQSCFKKFLSLITDPMYAALSNIDPKDAAQSIPYNKKQFESDPFYKIDYAPPLL